MNRCEHPSATTEEAALLSLYRYKEQMAHFVWHWSRREPVVVREMKPRVSWKPVVMERALKESERNGGPKEHLHVLNCQDGGMGPQLEIEHEDFFECEPANPPLPLTLQPKSGDRTRAGVNRSPRDGVLNAAHGMVMVLVLVEEEFAVTSLYVPLLIHGTRTCAQLHP